MNPTDPRFRHEWAIDHRHALMLQTVAVHTRPETVMEIGSFQGASTLAFVELLEARVIKRLILVEPKPTKELLALVASCSLHSAITIIPQPFSHEMLAAFLPDFVFIDGDHRDPDYVAAWACLSAEIPVIAMHDIAGRTEEFWGSVYGFRDIHERYDLAIIDDRQRDNERTHRGLGIAFFEAPEDAPVMLQGLQTIAQ